jgi:DNA-binding transcriptional ArsR family regulator
MTLDMTDILVQSSPFPPIEEVLSSKGKIKILKILAHYEELNISEIVRRAQLNHATVTQHLDYFKDVGIVQEKAFGRIKIYRLSPEDVKVKVIRELMESWEHSEFESNMRSSSYI